MPLIVAEVVEIGKIEYVKGYYSIIIKDVYILFPQAVDDGEIWKSIIEKYYPYGITWQEMYNNHTTWNDMLLYFI